MDVKSKVGILVATLTMLLAFLFLCGTAHAGVAKPSDFNTAEGIRKNVEEDYKESLEKLREDLNHSGLRLPISVENEIESSYYTSQTIVDEYNQSDSWPSWRRNERYRKALQAALWQQRALIKVLSAYRLVQTENEHLYDTVVELKITDERLPEAKTSMEISSSRWSQLKREIGELTKGNLSLTTESLEDEVAHRNRVLLKLYDYRESCMRANKVLSTLVREKISEYKSAKIQYEGNNVSINAGLKEIRGQLETIPQSEKLPEFEERYRGLLEEQTAIANLASEGKYIQAVERQRSLSAMIEELNSEISSEYQRLQEREAQLERKSLQEEKEEKREAKRKKAQTLFFLTAFVASLPGLVKLKRSFKVDPDLRLVYIKAGLKNLLAAAVLAVIAGTMTSIWAGWPFLVPPTSLFSYPRQRAKTRQSILFSNIPSGVWSAVGRVFDSGAAPRASPTTPYESISITSKMLFGTIPEQTPRSTPAESKPRPNPLPNSPGTKPGPVPIYEVRIVREVLNNMSVHAISMLPKEVYGLHWMDCSTGIIDTYTQIDSEEFVVRSPKRVRFNGSFYRHVQQLAALHKPRKRLSGDIHSHPGGSTKQSPADKRNTRSFWRTRRNTVFILGVGKGNGQKNWEPSDDGYEVRKTFGKKMIRVRAYSGTNEPKRILLGD